VVGAIHDHLCRRLTMHGVVHLVLDCGKEALGGCSAWSGNFRRPRQLLSIA
jgi:hypothetical protein